MPGKYTSFRWTNKNTSKFTTAPEAEYWLHFEYVALMTPIKNMYLNPETLILKFIYSEKATKFWEIFTLIVLCSDSQK